jgi:hypothetical protein
MRAMRWLVALAILLLALPVPAMAADGAANASSDQTPKKSKKVCRTDAATGSRITRSICLPQEEWDKYDAQEHAAGQKFIEGQIQQGGLIPTVEMTDPKLVAGPGYITP